MAIPVAPQGEMGQNSAYRPPRWHRSPTWRAIPALPAPGVRSRTSGCARSPPRPRLGL